MTTGHLLYWVNGQTKVTLNGEEHLLTKTSIIFCPAGMQHMRVSIRRVDKPIFHFSVVTATKYDNRAYGE